MCYYTIPANPVYRCSKCGREVYINDYLTSLPGTYPVICENCRLNEYRTIYDDFSDISVPGSNIPNIRTKKSIGDKFLSELKKAFNKPELYTIQFSYPEGSKVYIDDHRLKDDKVMELDYNIAEGNLLLRFKSGRFVQVRGILSINIIKLKETANE